MTQALPPLRQELSLHAGQNALDGSPTWTMHDPATNRFFQLGWPAFEILSRWPLGDAAAIVASVNRDTTLRIDADDVQDVTKFLLSQNLTQVVSAADSERLRATAAARRQSAWQWLLHHYLFFRLPLFKPAKWLDATARYVRFAFNVRFWWCVIAIALVGLFLVAQRWDSFLHSFTAYTGWRGMLGIGIALSFAKVLHELGHAYTAHRHGCRVPTMGVAFLVLWPVLYTDTNEAWKLASRRARLQIGAAGMAAELALAAFATLLWNFLPDGPLKAGVFLLATSTWLLTLAINLSPFMRFDGYFLLSDWLGVPNLHERAFAFGRWRLREALFSFGDPAPEVVTPQRRRFLILFAWATWIYRLLLFVGIALLVYHLFFKLLGVLLLIVELGWFVARPMTQEVVIWWQRRSQLQWNTATRRSAVLTAFACVAVCAPIAGGVRAPAVLQAEREQTLYAAAASQVQKVLVKPGDAVHVGQVLLTLASPDLQAQLAFAEAHERQLRWKLEQQSFDVRLQSSGLALRTQWESARESLAGVQALASQLEVHAPFDGRIGNDYPALQSGTWIAKGEPLIQVVAEAGVRVTAFVDAASARRLTESMQATFIADQPGMARVECDRAEPDRINVATLEHPVLASTYGGPIPTSAKDGRALTPLQSLFRVRMSQCVGISATSRELPGIAVLEGARESVLGRTLRAAIALWRREAAL